MDPNRRSIAGRRIGASAAGGEAGVSTGSATLSDPLESSSATPALATSFESLLVVPAVPIDEPNNKTAAIIVAKHHLP
jgi:hypothetical protein